MNEELWGNSIRQRLRAARQLKKPELESMIGNILKKCPLPLPGWPYGNSTSINPLIVTLGPSPGGSPSGEDWDKPQTPTAGVRHPGTNYNDGRGYWRKVRFLVKKLLVTRGALEEEDAYALFGNMNLDVIRRGDASNLPPKPDFGRWLLETIRDDFRPKLLICLGLLDKKRPVHDWLAEAFPGYNRAKPNNEYPFRGYGKKQLRFREWDVSAKP